MASDNLNVYAAEPLATGTCLVAPLGTPGPDGVDDALDAAFADLGHIGEDGFTEKIDRNIDKKKNWGGKTVKVLQKEYTHTFKFKMLETLKDSVLKVVYGNDNVVVTPAGSGHGEQVEIRKTSKKLPKLSWVIDSTDTELNAFYRNYIPEGQVMTLSDVKIVHTDTIEYEVELEAFEDPGGVYVHTWTDNGRAGS